jgi:magnesium chelatase subunit D
MRSDFPVTGSPVKLDFPFSAVVGQDDLKLALVLVAVDPSIGGVLISGERGTAKSTAARGLAVLLPKSPEGKSAPFVELPIGATEDRVIGALDISRVLQNGSAELRSGLLARADGGVLYVDEVNLLPDHIVDLLLDAASSGWVTIERDGISAGESARFVLVGTMNPEEGELRPQFVDRFGLCVQIRGLDAAGERIAAIRGRLAFDEDPGGVLEAVRPQEQALREGIVAARQRLTNLPISEDHLSMVAALSAEHQLDGIRGDLAIIKAARALAAWQAAPAITEEHIRRAAPFALLHRARRKNTRGQSRVASSLTPNSPNMTSQSTPNSKKDDAAAAGEGGAGNGASSQPDVPRLQPAPPALDLKPLHLVTDRVDRERPGRRDTESLASQHVIGVVPFKNTGTLAVGDTLIAAAKRGARIGERGLSLEASDLKQHERRGAGAGHVLFLVDASGSMATQRRLELAKAAALGLLASSYQRRDEVALMAFRAEGTDLVLPFTRHVARIEQALRSVPTGGRTPLARALLDAASLLQTRDPALLVLLTDGRANVAADGADPWEQALAACRELRAECAGALVIDCEAGPIVLGRARVLAQALGAECVALDALDHSTLTLHIHRRLETL